MRLTRLKRPSASGLNRRVHWRASAWAGIESATIMVFVLTPDSLASSVCGEELQRADELNKRKAAARLENWHRWRPA